MDQGVIDKRLLSLQGYLVDHDVAIDIIHGPALSLLAVNMAHHVEAHQSISRTMSCRWLLDYVARWSRDWYGSRVCPVSLRTLAESINYMDTRAQLKDASSTALLDANTGYENGGRVHACMCLRRRRVPGRTLVTSPTPCAVQAESSLSSAPSFSSSRAACSSKHAKYPACA